MLINGMMVFFTLVLLAAIFVPIFRIMPGWMAGVKDRRVAFHASAIDALDIEIARPQADHAHLARLIARREDNVSALRALNPGAAVPPLAAH
jgi:hypothetical protein